MAAYATLRGRPPMASWPVGVISYSKIDVTLKEPKVSHGLWLPSFFGKSPDQKIKERRQKRNLPQNPFPSGILIIIVGEAELLLN